ncbi:hypothetical protein GQ43DRAFT_277064 [Delitschia confertaspora ATCC 74209]|uniref:Uncharacterized protein n=1 Tax=Delitschia confertaspora ATCC 74209 TaxID=1513339 RepID=A0A9P4JRV8_9PLEO|nr:hypothetical protein GQ43DRAFT_277064 [Delitschia confertaspora ATCC 74209]
MSSKADIIDERKSNLPLPDQPPQASDWQSADSRNVNVGSGGVESNLATAGLRIPQTGTDVSSVGREGKDNLGGIPNDAVTRDKKDHKGLEQTTGKDYGYPGKSDPSSGISK